MKRICIFGDSITWGMGLPERKGWSDLLRNYLEEQSDYYLELYSLGIDRDTSRNLLRRIDAECEARKPEMIIIDIGTNDSLRYQRGGRLVNETTEASFENNLKEIIKTSQKYTNEIVFIGLAMGDDRLTDPLPRSTTGKRYNKKRMGRYNDIIRKVANSHNLAFIDIDDSLTDADFIDGMHPSLSGHQKIYQRIIFATDGYFTERNTIVDEEDNVIGAKLRKDIEKNDIYRVSGLWLRNNRGEVLLAQRSFSKSHDPGKWGPAVAGTVAEGDSYLDTIIRKTEEEIGLTSLTFEVGPKQLRDGEWRYWSQKYYATTDKNIEDMKIQKDEVEQVRWFNEKELTKLLVEKPDMFIPSMRDY